jgi:hypothetical protein
MANIATLDLKVKGKKSINSFKFQKVVIFSGLRGMRNKSSRERF